MGLKFRPAPVNIAQIRKFNELGHLRLEPSRCERLVLARTGLFQCWGPRRIRPLPSVGCLN
jgi:hypothetical protein